MFVSAFEIAQSRQHTLNNLLGFSHTCLDAGQRWNAAFTGHLRQLLARRGECVAIVSPSDFTEHYRQDSAQSSALFEESLAILGDVHQAMISHAETQVRVFDEIAFALIRHAEQSSPWESILALNILKTTLTSAENTLHEMGVATSETLALAEQETQQLIETMQPAPRKRASPRKNAA